MPYSVTMPAIKSLSVTSIFNEWLEEHGEPDKTENFAKIFKKRGCEMGFL